MNELYIEIESNDSLSIRRRILALHLAKNSGVYPQGFTSASVNTTREEAIWRIGNFSLSCWHFIRIVPVEEINAGPYKLCADFELNSN